MSSIMPSNFQHDVIFYIAIGACIILLLVIIALKIKKRIQLNKKI